LKSYFLTFLKIAIPLGVVVWLLGTIPPDQLEQLRARPKNWPMLGSAFLLSLVATCITFVRWYLLVRAIQLPFRLSDAFRLGFLGYLFNFISIGAVGGDLFKAFFLAREQPRRRTEAVSTVIVDRMIGLYALLLVTSTAILFADFPSPSPALRSICNLTHLATLLGGLAIVMVLIPGFTRGSLSEWLAGLPRIGRTLQQLISAVRMFRDKPLTMLTIVAMSMLVQSFFVVALYLIARSLFAVTPTLAEHFVVVPLSMVAGALPLTPAGLGSFELAMDELYARVPAAGAGDVIGVLVALVFRLVSIAIAAVGVVYYWTSRREVEAVLHAVEETQTHAERSASELAPSPANHSPGNSPTP
jgi:uncharacterized protein (TIRG00374 family)